MKGKALEKISEMPWVNQNKLLMNTILDEPYLYSDTLKSDNKINCLPKKGSILSTPEEFNTNRNNHYGVVQYTDIQYNDINVNIDPIYTTNVHKNTLKLHDTSVIRCSQDEVIMNELMGSPTDGAVELYQAEKDFYRTANETMVIPKDMLQEMLIHQRRLIEARKQCHIYESLHEKGGARTVGLEAFQEIVNTCTNKLMQCGDLTVGQEKVDRFYFPVDDIIDECDIATETDVYDSEEEDEDLLSIELGRCSHPEELTNAAQLNKAILRKFSTSASRWERHIKAVDEGREEEFLKVQKEEEEQIENVLTKIKKRHCSTVEPLYCTSKVFRGSIDNNRFVDLLAKRIVDDMIHRDVESRKALKDKAKKGNSSLESQFADHKKFGSLGSVAALAAEIKNETQTFLAERWCSLIMLMLSMRRLFECSYNSGCGHVITNTLTPIVSRRARTWQIATNSIKEMEFRKAWVLSRAPSALTLKKLNSEFLQDWPIDGIDMMLEIASFVSFPRGKFALIEGESTKHVFIIVNGVVEILVRKNRDVVKCVKPKGRADCISITKLGPGKLFGEMSVVLDEPRCASVLCLSDKVDLLRISHNDLLRCAGGVTKSAWRDISVNSINRRASNIKTAFPLKAVDLEIHEIFRHWPYDARSDLKELFKPIFFPQSHFIFSDDNGINKNSCIIIISGRVSLDRPFERSGKVTYGPGDILGENETVVNLIRRYTATADIPTEAFILTRDAYATVAMDNTLVASISRDLIAARLCARIDTPVTPPVEYIDDPVLRFIASHDALLRCWMEFATPRLVWPREVLIGPGQPCDRISIAVRGSFSVRSAYETELSGIHSRMLRPCKYCYFLEEYEDTKCVGGSPLINMGIYQDIPHEEERIDMLMRASDSGVRCTASSPMVIEKQGIWGVVFGAVEVGLRCPVSLYSVWCISTTVVWDISRAKFEWMMEQCHPDMWREVCNNTMRCGDFILKHIDDLNQLEKGPADALGSK